MSMNPFGLITRAVGEAVAMVQYAPGALIVYVMIGLIAGFFAGRAIARQRP